MSSYSFTTVLFTNSLFVAGAQWTVDTRQKNSIRDIVENAVIMELWNYVHKQLEAWINMFKYVQNYYSINILKYVQNVLFEQVSRLTFIANLKII